MSRSNGFAVLDADAARVIVKLVDATGKVVYEETVTKTTTTTPSASR